MAEETKKIKAQTDILTVIKEYQDTEVTLIKSYEYVLKCLTENEANIRRIIGDELYKEAIKGVEEVLPAAKKNLEASKELEKKINEAFLNDSMSSVNDSIFNSVTKHTAEISNNVQYFKSSALVYEKFLKLKNLKDIDKYFNGYFGGKIEDIHDADFKKEVEKFVSNADSTKSKNKESEKNELSAEMLSKVINFFDVTKLSEDEKIFFNYCYGRTCINDDKIKEMREKLLGLTDIDENQKRILAALLDGKELDVDMKPDLRSLRESLVKEFNEDELKSIDYLISMVWPGRSTSFSSFVSKYLGKNSNFMSYYILGFQRFQKYPLLTQELIKNIKSVDEETSKKFVIGLAAIKSEVGKINQEKERIEDENRNATDIKNFIKTCSPIFKVSNISQNFSSTDFNNFSKAINSSLKKYGATCVVGKKNKNVMFIKDKANHKLIRIKLNSKLIKNHKTIKLEFVNEGNRKSTDLTVENILEIMKDVMLQENDNINEPIYKMKSFGGSIPTELINFRGKFSSITVKQDFFRKKPAIKALNVSNTFTLEDFLNNKLNSVEGIKCELKGDKIIVRPSSGGSPIITITKKAIKNNPKECEFKFKFLSKVDDDSKKTMKTIIDLFKTHRPVAENFYRYTFFGVNKKNLQDVTELVIPPQKVQKPVESELPKGPTGTTILSARAAPKIQQNVKINNMEIENEPKVDALKFTAQNTAKKLDDQSLSGQNQKFPDANKQNIQPVNTATGIENVVKQLEKFSDDLISSGAKASDSDKKLSKKIKEELAAFERSDRKDIEKLNSVIFLANAHRELELFKGYKDKQVLKARTVHLEQCESYGYKFFKKEQWQNEANEINEVTNKLERSFLNKVSKGFDANEYKNFQAEIQNAQKTSELLSKLVLSGVGNRSVMFGRDLIKSSKKNKVSGGCKTIKEYHKLSNESIKEARGSANSMLYDGVAFKVTDEKLAIIVPPMKSETPPTPSIERTYNEQTKKIEITIGSTTDIAILVSLDSSCKFAPLVIEIPQDQKTKKAVDTSKIDEKDIQFILKMFVASKIRGVPVKLSEKYKEIVEKNLNFADKYKILEAIEKKNFKEKDIKGKTLEEIVQEVAGMSPAKTPASIIPPSQSP